MSFDSEARIQESSWTGQSMTTEQVHDQVASHGYGLVEAQASGTKQAERAGMRQGINCGDRDPVVRLRAERGGTKRPDLFPQCDFPTMDNRIAELRAEGFPPVVGPIVEAEQRIDEAACSLFRVVGPFKQTSVRDVERHEDIVEDGTQESVGIPEVVEDRAT